MDITTQQISFL